MTSMGRSRARADATGEGRALRFASRAREWNRHSRACMCRLVSLFSLVPRSRARAKTS